MHVTTNGEIQIQKAVAERAIKTVWDDPRYIAGDYGTKWLTDLGLKVSDDIYPKSLHTVVDSIVAVSDTHAIVLDYFAGSGTSGHAVIHLNRNGAAMSFVLAEMGWYYESVLRPRVAKVIYSSAWKDGQAQAHDQGLSALVKSFAVESYEDALNNLPALASDMFEGSPKERVDALIRYSLDLELGPQLLDLNAFLDPWSCTIHAQLAGDDEIRPQRVDLVETFNYLIGLKVGAYGPMERYAAEFERADHADGLGRLKVRGRLNRDADGPFVFQRVEGELNDGAATRVLVVWRKLTNDPEKDAAVLEAWMERHRENTKERSEHRDYQVIYINGPVTLPQPTQEVRTVYPLEETFKAKMFEDCDGGVGG